MVAVAPAGVFAEKREAWQLCLLAAVVERGAHLLAGGGELVPIGSSLVNRDPLRRRD